MESLYNFFSKDIEVIYREDHTPTFNGWESIHEALLECNEIYRDLDFADQIAIGAYVTNMLCPLNEDAPQPSTPPTTSNKHYIYTSEYYAIEDDHNCIVFDVNSGHIIFQEWFRSLKANHIMDSIDDVEGLMLYLVHHGELLEGDVIQYQSRESDDGSLES